MQTIKTLRLNMLLYRQVCKNPGTKRKIFSGLGGSLKAIPSGLQAWGYDPVTLWVICPPGQLWTEASFQGAARFFMLMDIAEQPAPGHWLKGTGDYTLVRLTHWLPRWIPVDKGGWEHLSSGSLGMKCVCFLSLSPSLLCPNPRIAMDIWSQQP